MIWDNFSIFRTNCAISFDTRAYMLRGFLPVTRRIIGVQNFRNLLCFWPTTLRVYVCWNFAEVFFVVSCSSLKEVRQCRIWVCPALLLTKQCSASSFTTRWSVTSLREPGERNFNAVSHKPTRAPIQSFLESWRLIVEGFWQRNRSACCELSRCS